jgi:glucokinase
LLENAGSPKRYRNLFGVTLGTGFGGGIVRDGALFVGDNSVAGEIWLARNKLERDTNAEEGASIRGVRRVYAAQSGMRFEDTPEPKAIYEIAEGNAAGNRAAAQEAFRRMGEVAGDAIAQAITLLDGLVVVGGGIAGAHRQFLPAIVDEMNGTYQAPDGRRFPRLAQRAFNLEDPKQLEAFLTGETKELTVPGSSRKVKFDGLQRTGVGISRLGTSEATAIGAYAFALQESRQKGITMRQTLLLTAYGMASDAGTTVHAGRGRVSRRSQGKLRARHASGSRPIAIWHCIGRRTNRAVTTTI